MSSGGGWGLWQMMPSKSDDPNATVCCMSCFRPTRRYIEPGRTLLRFDCPRCRQTDVPFQLGRDVGDDQGVPTSWSVDNVRGTVRVGEGERVWMPRCCTSPQYKYEAGIDVVTCTSCHGSWTVAMLASGQQQQIDEKDDDYADRMRRLKADSEKAAELNQLREVVERASAAVETVREMAVEAVMPVLQGSVIGYRAWRVNMDEWELRGTGQNQPWRPDTDGVVQASCVYSTHAAPAADHTCGLYALARFSEANTWWSALSGEIIAGAIEAWADPDPLGLDRMFFHRDGFRAQYAKVVLLAVDEDQPRAKQAVTRALAADYGADICKLKHLEDAAKEHGQLVPDEMLQWAAGEDVWTGAGIPPNPKLTDLMHQAIGLREQINDVMAAWAAGKLTAAQARELMATTTEDWPTLMSNPKTGG